MFFLGSHVTELFQPGVVQALTEEAAKAGRVLTQPEIAEAVTSATTTAVWKFIIRPIAVGGMLVGAGYTLFKMRKNLGAGIKRARMTACVGRNAEGATPKYRRLAASMPHAPSPHSTTLR